MMLSYKSEGSMSLRRSRSVMPKRDAHYRVTSRVGVCARNTNPLSGPMGNI